VSSDQRHSVSVAAVIVDSQGRALLIQRRDNARWEPPGGVLELGETITAGLRREVREETGLEVEPERLTGVYKNMRLGVVTLVFLCHPVGGAITETDEAAGCRWAAADEVRRLAREAQAMRVIDGLAAAGGPPPAVREHDGNALL
jgi:8-oxo-dGTP diphosphatase